MNVKDGVIGTAHVSSGAGALHSKCPRGPRGSQGAGDSRVGPPPRPIADDKIHQGTGFKVCLQFPGHFYVERRHTPIL